MDINADLIQWFINFLIENFGSGINMLDQQLAEKLHKPIIRNFKKRKVHSSFIDKFGVLILLTCN